MLSFIIESIIWILCIYGLLSFAKDVIEEKSYTKIKNNIKLILTVKDVEERNRELHKKIKFF